MKASVTKLPKKVALLLLVLLLPCILASVPCVFRDVTTSGPLKVGDANCTVVSSTFSGLSAVLVVDLEHLVADGGPVLPCSITVSVINTTFSSGAALLITGVVLLPGVVVTVSVLNCIFSDAVLQVTGLQLASASSIVVSRCVVEWTTNPSAQFLELYCSGGPGVSPTSVC